MKKKKVAIITNIPAPYRIPLFEKIAQKVDLDVFFTHMTEENREWEVKIGDKFNYEILKGYTLKYSGKEILLYYVFNPSIINKIRKNNYDVIIVGGYTSLTSQIVLLLCKLMKIPFILWSGSTLEDEALSTRKLAYPFIKIIMKLSNGFIVYGTKAKEYIQSFGIPEEKIFIAINVGGVDFFMGEKERLESQKTEIKEKLKIKSKYNILYVGQLLHARKGVEYLVEAFKKLKKENPDVGLMLLGDGPQREEIIESCSGVDDLYLFKFVQPPEVPLYYAASDIFVIPSFYDRFSIVLSEAMASGLPVISTEKNGASIDLIEEGKNGYIIKERSADEIYRGLKLMLESPENLEKMGNCSSKIIKENLNQDKTTSSFIAAIDFVLNKKKS